MDYLLRLWQQYREWHNGGPIIPRKILNLEWIGATSFYQLNTESRDLFFPESWMRDAPTAFSDPYIILSGRQLVPLKRVYGYGVWNPRAEKWHYGYSLQAARMSAWRAWQ